MIEREIIFKSGGCELSGTLLLPDEQGNYPCVLLITGSGQVDRNENAKKMRLNAFFDISTFLANNGIASLRYDKRGVGRSTGDYWSTGFYDHVQDAEAALEYLKQQPNILPNQLFVLGHSEGAFIGTRIAGKRTNLAGLILISGSTQSGESVLKWQARQIARTMTGFNGWLIKKFRIDVENVQQKQIDKIKKSKKDWYRQQLIVKVNAKWMREFLDYNPIEDMAKITIPTLAITGTKDIQVDPADLEKMAQIIKSPFESYLIQDMTHLLRSEKGNPSISKYKAEIKEQIEPKLLSHLSAWLSKWINYAN